MEDIDMNLKYKVKETLEVRFEVLEGKIDTYLNNNSYRITERGQGYIIFAEDEFSDRSKSRYDFHKRIGEGKFVFKYLTDEETSVELIYLTSLSYYMFLVLSLSAFGIYLNTIIMPIVMSTALTLPFILKFFYLNEHVFDEIMDS
ncbi:hypothetical protein LPB86_03850 [Pedobacter sp. MC2016-14]|uniref:hypothetical protein n=1 Tax=Pedobacter sp. MC2016-14 TaxID=2897327 RepID=UPI001E404CD5|nr:hypothetical protein [Pedobacter sp. MC2016-14]MCD0487348.1 hypothetical protein [Pedobacter sp. MC2016-14]